MLCSLFSLETPERIHVFSMDKYSGNSPGLSKGIAAIMLSVLV